MNLRRFQLILFLLVPVVNFIPRFFKKSAFEDDPDVLIQPASYAFSIWGIIFFGMIVYSVFQLNARRTDSKYLKQATIAGILAATASIAFVPISYTNLHGLILFNILWHLVALIWLFITLQKRRKIEHDKLTKWYYLPTQLYLGWISAATAVAVALFLRGTLGVHFREETEVAITVGVIAALVAVAIFIATKHGRAVALVIVWALIAIIVKHWEIEPILISCIFGIILIVIAIVFSTVKVRRNKF